MTPTATQGAAGAYPARQTTHKATAPARDAVAYTSVTKTAGTRWAIRSRRTPPPTAVTTVGCDAAEPDHGSRHRKGRQSHRIRRGIEQGQDPFAPSRHAVPVQIKGQEDADGQRPKKRRRFPKCPGWRLSGQYIPQDAAAHGRHDGEDGNPEEIHLLPHAHNGAGHGEGKETSSRSMISSFRFQYRE